MAKRIFKYSFGLGTVTTIEMPVGAKILSIQDQHSVITIWAMVDPSAHYERRRFQIFGTGWDIEEDYNGEYLATVQQGNFVWHVFEEHTK